MSDRPNAGLAPTTGRPGRPQLQAAFQAASGAGPSGVPQQIRYMLALSQLIAAAPSPASTAPPLSIGEARLMALVAAAATLTDPQRQNLLKDIQQIKDENLRILFTVRVISQTPQPYQKVLQRLWKATDNLTDPYIRSQVLFTLAPLMRVKANPNNQDISVQLKAVIQIAQQFTGIESQVRGLVTLAPYLPYALRVQFLNRLLDAVNRFQSDRQHANAINVLADYLLPEIEVNAFQSARTIQSPVERVRALTALARTASTSVQNDIQRITLQSIGEITSEDERIDALVTFAPYLEFTREDNDFPKLLQEALGIAITLERRHLRARALVALAPNLTSDLKGEALAAVHNLDSERERAMMLAELAPNLPPDMLVASLAVAHTMREQDSRVHALTMLARSVPLQARNQTMLDALAAASNLPHHYERVTALVQLMDILPEHLKDQAFTNALETTRLIDNENTRARAFGMLGSYIPTNLLTRAVETVYEIEDVQQRLNALIGIIQHVKEDQRDNILAHMLDYTRQMPFDYKRARALVSIAPYLTPRYIPEALQITHHLEDAFDRVTAYIALAQNLSPQDRPQIIQKAWQDNHHIDDGYDRSSALVALEPFLPETMNNALAQTALQVIRSIEDEYDRASAITILAPLLAKGDKAPYAERDTTHLTVLKSGFQAALHIQPQPLYLQQLQSGIHLALNQMELEKDDCYALWTDITQHMVNRPLSDVLIGLSALIPLLSTFLSDEELKTIANILGVR